MYICMHCLLHANGTVKAYHISDVVSCIKLLLVSGTKAIIKKSLLCSYTAQDFYQWISGYPIAFNIIK